MNPKYAATAPLLLALVLPSTCVVGRGFGGGGFDRGGGGFDRGGFDFRGDAREGGTHSSTGPMGTSRTTTATNTGGGYSRSTTATNGDYNRTSGGSASSNGNYSHYSSGSDAFGSHNSSTSGNAYSGNYSHNGSGSNPYGSYSNFGSGNTYNHSYSGSGTATNRYGQTYNTATYANNGYVYHGAAVSNPVYYGYPAWGWNAGVAWYPASIYYGGAFWGAFAVGAATAVAYGTVVAANNATITSYQVEPQSPGAKLLGSYKLTQTPCGTPNLIVIYGPNNSVICAEPNQLVAAGNYGVNTSTLTIVSEKSAVSGASAAAAPKPLAAIPVGASENYHVTAQGNTPKGKTSTNSYVRITRNGPAQFAVSVDGAPPVLVSVGPSGITSPVSSSIKTVLQPFLEMSALMRGAPEAVAQNSSWGAVIPVPVSGQSDAVPVNVSVSQYTPAAATIVAAGQNATEVRPGVRTFPTNVSVNATMFYNQSHVLTHGSGNVSIVLQKRLGRSDHFGNTWTVSLVAN